MPGSELLIQVQRTSARNEFLMPLLLSVYIYIYMYIERERDVDIYIYIKREREISCLLIRDVYV